MSFSFNARGADKAALKAALVDNFDRVVTNQPIHGRDVPAMKRLADAYVDLVEEPADGRDLEAIVSGSIGTNNDPDYATGKTTALNFMINVNSVSKL